MTKKEAAMLLELITLSYPHAYRDMANDWKMATINMWYSSFMDVPYPIIEQAFNHYRMTHKFPPTVAEMVEELRHIHYQAIECAMVHKNLGNEDGVRHFREIMACTHRYKNPEELGALQAIPARIEGGWNGPTHYGLNSGTEGRDELR